PLLSPLSLHDALPILLCDVEQEPLGRCEGVFPAGGVLLAGVDADHAHPLTVDEVERVAVEDVGDRGGLTAGGGRWHPAAVDARGDRKSTRLNSSHVKI